MRQCPTCRRSADDSTNVCPHDGTLLPPLDPLLGCVVDGKYRVDELLGIGGMGAVYLATQLSLNRRVAVKFLKLAITGEPTALDRFRREALLLASLKHPHIITVYDFGVAPDVGAYLVTEFIEGRSLRDEIAHMGGRLPAATAVEYARSIAQALVEAHAMAIIHRDLKPLNVMIEPTRSGDRVKVLDFGLAKLNGADGAGTSITKPGLLVGTPMYVAPELPHGTEADARSDIYSIGCMVYEMLVGRPPFVSSNMWAVLSMHASQQPVPPSQIVDDVPHVLELLVLRMLEKDPNSRPQTAAELDAALAAVAQQVEPAPDREAVTARLVLAYGNDQAPHGPAMVGRAAELAELERRFALVEAGTCHLVLVSGPTGIGKSRLVEEFERTVSAHGVRVRHGQFDEAGGAFPYSGFFDLIAEHLRADPAAAEDLKEPARELAALFPALAAASSFAALLGGAPPEAAGTPKDPTATFELLARTLQAMAAGRPLVVTLDALHAANVSVDALEFLVRRLALVPVFLIGIARSEEMTRRHPLMRLQAAMLGNRRFAVVELGALDEAEYAELVAQLTGGPVAPATVAQLREVTDANPLFTSELVRSLVESGRLVEAEGGLFSLDAAAGHLAEALPESISEAVRRRVDALPPDLIEALELASVLGREFELEEFEALVAASSEGDDPDELADEFVTRGLLLDKRHGRDDRLVFSSGVLRDVIHAGLSRRRRKLLHRRAAEHLERRFAGREAAVLPQLVLHYTEADVSEKVVAYGLDLAERSLAARAVEDAAKAARAVLDALAGEGAAERSAEGRTRRLLGEALALGPSPGEALREFEAAVRAFERAGETAEALTTTARVARVAWEAQQVEEAGHWVARGLEVADRAGAVAPDAADTARAVADLLELGATLANLSGEYDRARLLLERAGGLKPRLEEGNPERDAPRGGRLVVGLGAAVAARHPVRIRFGHESDVLANAYETLVSVGDRGRLAGLLAESWTSEEAGRVFRFALREGVRLHDGRELTADLACAAIAAAIATARGRLPAGFAAIRGAAEAAAGNTLAVAGLSAPSPYEVRVELNDPVPIYPAMLADPATAIAVPSRDGFAGTGPFRLAALEGDRVRMERHEGAWRETARLDELEFQVVETSAERAEGLRFGQLDVVERLDAEQMQDLASRGVGVQWLEVPQMTVTLLAINPEGPIARWPEVLRAVTGVATAPELVRDAGGRLARPAETLLPPGVPGHDANRRREAVSVKQAAEVLRGSGLELPVRLEVAVSPSVAEQHAALVAAMVARWGEIGIEAVVPVLTHEEFLARLETPGETGAVLMRWRGDYPDPDGFLYPMFDMASGPLGRWCGSEALDELMAAARVEQDPAARELAYAGVEAALRERGLVVPLMHEVSTWAVSPRVRGLEARTSAPHASFASASRVRAEAKRAARGTLTIPVDIIGSLEPLEVEHSTEAEIVSMVFEPLLRTGARAEIVPCLAEAYGTEQGGRRYWFRLREGLRFHDGRPMTTRDVRYSLERMLRTGSEWGRQLASIRGAGAMLRGEADRLEGVRLRSDRELVVDLDEPLAILPALLSVANAGVVPEGTERVAGTWRTGCVGTGPFRVADISAGRIELEANPDYWRQGYPRVDRILFEEVRDIAERIDGLREGRYSGFFLSLMSTTAALAERGGAIRSYAVPRVNTLFAVFNCQRGPLADEGLRRRLIDSVDSVALFGRLSGMALRPASGFIPPGLLGHQPAPAERARRAATPLEGRDLRLTCGVPGQPLRELARALGETMGVSLDVRLSADLSADIADAARNGSFDMFVIGWNSDVPDPDGMVSSTLHSKLGVLGALVGSDEVDRLIERGRREPEADVRREIYAELETVLRERALVLPIGHGTPQMLFEAGVEGVETNLFPPMISWEKLSLRTP